VVQGQGGTVPDGNQLAVAEGEIPVVRRGRDHLAHFSQRPQLRHVLAVRVRQRELARRRDRDYPATSEAGEGGGHPRLGGRLRPS
jgi:hypothetical protein